MNKKQKFLDNLEKVCSQLSRREAMELRSKVIYWSHDKLWTNLVDYINVKYPPNSEDSKTVKVYASLLGKSETYIKFVMKVDGY